MVVQEKIGNLTSFAVDGRTVDLFPVEWYETNKRILRRPTRGGRELALKFLQESPALCDGDVLHADDTAVIVVEILPCETLVIRMTAPQDIASICYEIGNRHLPLFIDAGELLVPAEDPIHRWLIASGYDVRREDRKLLHPLRSTVAAHAHPNSSGSGSLFSRIMQITNSRT